MKDQNLSRLAAATVTCLGMALFVYLFQPLCGAKNPEPQTQAANPKSKRAKATVKPFAPPIPTIATPAAHMTEEKRQAIAAAKKELASVVATHIATTTAPLTRNLIMIFDAGYDAGPILTTLAMGLLQQCSFIIINKALLQRFITFSAQNLIPDENAANEPGLQKALSNLSYADVFFSPSNWYVYAVNGTDARANKQDTFYLFVPRNYRNSLLSNTLLQDYPIENQSEQEDHVLGLNLSRLGAPLRLTTKEERNTIAQEEASDGYYNGTVITNALGKIFCTNASNMVGEISLEAIELKLQHANKTIDALTDDLKKITAQQLSQDVTPYIAAMSDAEGTAALEAMHLIGQKKASLERHLKNLIANRQVLEEQKKKLQAQEELKQPISTAPSHALWNVYCTGHGDKGDRDTGQIAGISIPSFENLINFFNNAVHTNFFVYLTCFGGDEHLTTPYATNQVSDAIQRFHLPLTYPIAACSLLNITTKSIPAILSTQPPSRDYLSKIPLEALPHDVKYPVNFYAGLTFDTFFSGLEDFATGTSEALPHDVKYPVYFYTGLTFDTFFSGLEDFATGTSTAKNLVRTINAVGNFLTPDLKKREHLENTPQIRLPGTSWFMVMRMAKELSITHLTRSSIMAHNYAARNNNKPWELDCTGEKIVLVQSHDIALPLIIDGYTKLIPLIQSMPFFQQKPLVVNNIIMPHLFAFTAPVALENLCLSYFLSSQLGSKIKNSPFNNTIILIDTLVGGNDLDEKQQVLISAESILELKQVMIFLDAANPLLPDKKNAVFFAHNNKYFLIDIDEAIKKLPIKRDDIILIERSINLDNVISELDDKTATQYGELYEQCHKHCIDKRIEPLRKENAKNFETAFIRTSKIKIKQAIDNSKELLSRNKEFFLSKDATTRDVSLSFFKILLETNQRFVFPVIIESAHEAALSTDYAVRNNAFALFTPIIQRDRGFKEAALAASVGMLTKNSSSFFSKITDLFRTNVGQTIRSSALALFKELFKKQQGFAQAATCIAEGIKSDDAQIRASVISLFEQLMTPDETLSKAPAISQLENLLSREQVLQSVQKATRAIHIDGPAAAKNDAQKLQKMASEYETKIAAEKITVTKKIQDIIGAYEDAPALSALRSLKALVEHNQGFDIAFDAAALGITSLHEEVKTAALDIFSALFAKGQGFSHALNIASTGILSKDNQRVEGAMALFKLFIQRSKEFSAQEAKEFNETLTFIPEAIASNRSDTQTMIHSRILDLLTILLPGKKGLCEFYQIRPNISPLYTWKAEDVEKLIATTFTTEEIAQAKKEAAAKASDSKESKESKQPTLTQ